MWFTDVTLGGQKSVVLQDTSITILKATTHILAFLSELESYKELKNRVTWKSILYVSHTWYWRLHLKTLIQYPDGYKQKKC